MTATHLFDTSAVIAFQRGTPLDELEDVSWVVSAMTIAELNIGVLRSLSAAEHQGRLRLFEEVNARPALAFDRTVARTYAELMAWASSIGSRPSKPDAIIAATAATSGLTLVTFDQGFRAIGDFDGLDVLVFDNPESPRIS